MKTNDEGNIDAFEARLGIFSRHNIHYDDTNAPTADFSTIILLLLIGLAKNSAITQYDVTGAFLHGDSNHNI